MKLTNAVISVSLGVLLSLGLWGDALKSKGKQVAEDVGIAIGAREKPEPVSATVIVSRDGSVDIDGKRVR